MTREDMEHYAEVMSIWAQVVQRLREQGGKAEDRIGPNVDETSIRVLRTVTIMEQNLYSMQGMLLDTAADLRADAFMPCSGGTCPL